LGDGEVTNLRSQSSGHIYFTLKDGRGRSWGDAFYFEAEAQ